MNTIQSAGEAMLQSHEGSRQIAAAVWEVLTALGRRIGKSIANVSGSMGRASV